jgi:hypothetical protein
MLAFANEGAKVQNLFGTQKNPTFAARYSLLVSRYSLLVTRFTLLNALNTLPTLTLTLSHGVMVAQEILVLSV